VPGAHFNQLNSRCDDLLWLAQHFVLFRLRTSLKARLPERDNAHGLECESQGEGTSQLHPIEDAAAYRSKASPANLGHGKRRQTKSTKGREAGTGLSPPTGNVDSSWCGGAALAALHWLS
jgi:hypothetical protein